jgi:ParB/RepB/Spo0J family partition protein
LIVITEIDGQPIDPNRVYDLPMDRVFADEVFNVRGYIDPMSVSELAKEIKLNGLLQPITVQPYERMPDKDWRIVAGYRRYMAHRINQATTIRSLIKVGLSDDEARLANLIENTQRQELNIIQEAKAVEYFKMRGWTQERVAERLGKSRGWAQLRFYVLDLPDEIQKEIEAGLLTSTQIMDVWKLGNNPLYGGYDAQIAYVREVKDAKILGKKRKIKPEDMLSKPPERKARTPNEIFDLQGQVQECLGVSCLAAKTLAWAAGEIDDLEIHEAIAKAARENGKFHRVPDGLVRAAQTT